MMIKNFIKYMLLLVIYGQGSMCRRIVCIKMRKRGVFVCQKGDDSLESLNNGFTGKRLSVTSEAKSRNVLSTVQSLTKTHIRERGLQGNEYIQDV